MWIWLVVTKKHHKVKRNDKASFLKTKHDVASDLEGHNHYDLIYLELIINNIMQQNKYKIN